MQVSRLIFLLVLGFYNAGVSQNPAMDSLKTDSSRVLLLVKKGKKTDMLSPMYHPDGMLLIKNGVYDFMLNGDKLFYARILEINDNDLSVEKIRSTNGELWKDTILIDLRNDDLGLNMNSLDNGMSGLGTKLRSNKYDFRVEWRKKHFEFSPAKVCNDKDCTSFVMGYQYINMAGLKPIYVENGKLYLLDGKKIHRIENDKFVLP